MTKVIIDGITYSSKKEAVLAIKPDAYLKSGVYVTYIDPEARQRYLKRARNSMHRQYHEDEEYKERHKQQCRERYRKRKLNGKNHDESESMIL